MSTHTPGPSVQFKLKHYESDEYPSHCKADARLIGNDGLCYGILFGGEDSYPDAQKIRSMHSVIAAAPELLAALKDYQAYFESMSGHPCNSVSRNAKAAIAKAEGRF